MEPTFTVSNKHPWYQNEETTIFVLNKTLGEKYVKGVLNFDHLCRMIKY